MSDCEWFDPLENMTPFDESSRDSYPLLDEDAFQNEQSRKLFEAVDELRSCGANDIDLPELVIVGDQSAGKSSLLQSLTDIPFPVAGRLCTRFPTRIVSRRTPGKAEEIKISIKPHIFSSLDQAPWQERSDQYESFQRTCPNFTASDFKEVLREAGILMGISSFEQEASSNLSAGTEEKHFSNDVLKVEVSGPNRSYFSIVDVPGIFQSLTKDLTEIEKMGVKNMAHSYMSNNQSVIICVASGTNDLANQAAFDMASDCDPKGQRTVGVITKCDISQHVDEVIETAQNIEKKLHHGWFVVRNRTPKEVTEEVSRHERSRREQSFFESSPWNKLDESRRGTESLKRYLADLLCTRIQENFPTILENITSRRTETQAQLESLGVSRGTIEQKRAYLMKIAQRYHSLATQALHGQYSFLSGGPTKLRMTIRNTNDDFAAAMKSHGHSLPFVEIPRIRYTSTYTVSDSEEESQGSLPPPYISSVSGSNNSTDLSSNVSYTSSFASVAWPKVSPLNLPHEGTVHTPFKVTYQYFQYPSATKNFQSITAAPLYHNHSFEELRLSDYLQGHNIAGRPVSQGSAFGGSKVTPSDTPLKAPALFDGSGQKIATATPLFFGEPQPGGFGGFGNQPSPLGRVVSDTAINNTVPSDRRASSSPGQDPFTGHVSDRRSDSHVKSRTSRATKAGSVGNSGLDRHQHGEPVAEIYTWIRNEVKACRGVELEGTLNPDVLPILFHYQAKNWGPLSEQHCKLVATNTSDSVHKILESACADKGTRIEIATVVQTANDAKLKICLTQLSDRMDRVLSSHLQTQDSSFGAKIREARLLRFQNALERYRSSGNGRSKSTVLTIDLRDTAALFAELHFSNAQNLEHEIHDALKAYYEIARENFIEYVTQLVVEPYLNDADGPVLLFSPVYVASLTDEVVERLAAEDPKIVKERKEKQETLSRLMRAEEIALRYSIL